MWVSTTVTADTPEEANEQLSIAFNRLFNYIEGENERGEKNKYSLRERVSEDERKRERERERERERDKIKKYKINEHTIIIDPNNHKQCTHHSLPYESIPCTIS